MKEYQHKQILRTILYSKVSLTIFFLIIILLLRSIVELNNKRMDVSALREESLAKKTELQDKLQASEQKNNDIHTDRGVEEYIRTTQPVVKNDGEGVIVVYDDNKTPVVPVKQDMNVWEKLLVWLRSFMAK